MISELFIDLKYHKCCICVVMLMLFQGTCYHKEMLVVIYDVGPPGDVTRTGVYIED